MNSNTIKHIGDCLSATATLATLISWLPPIAALMSIVWTGIRIYEYYKNKKVGE